MSFIDLISSGKGPGVIGMLMAVLVLLGFGALFTFAFDEGLQGGGPTLAGAVRQNENTIAEKKVQIAEAKATIPARKKVAEDTQLAISVNNSLESQVATLKAAAAESSDSLAKAMESFESYKNDYRAFVRNSPENRQIKELTTKSGTVYTNVDIRNVTAVGLEIRHSDGLKRIAYKELPDEMQNYYQFDEDQKLAEMEREAAQKKKHITAVSLVNEAAGAMAAEGRARDQKAAEETLRSHLASGKACLRTITGEIRQLENAIGRANNAAASASAAGRMHLNKAGPLRGQLSQKRAEHARVLAELARLRSQL